MRLSRAFSLLLCALSLMASPAPANAQELETLLANLPRGLEAEPDEVQAWLYTQVEHYLRARESAEAILVENPDSYVAHLVLGLTHHYAEANFPRALFHHQQGLVLYERRHGTSPGARRPWRWHVALLKELARTHGDLEHYSEQLAHMARYNQLYDPDVVAERAWPLMKMRRFDEARLAVRLGLAGGRPDQRRLALNALCAIEFEAGNNRESYDACRAAVENAGSPEAVPAAVDLTNFAEAARSLFDLEQAERIGLRATGAPLSWYANPWLELAELYLRQGRLEDSLSALKEIPRYRNLRPPHVRESDRNETRRALASFLLVMGRPDAAIEVTDKALVAPDRRAHASRDPVQDRLVIALLDRRARLTAAQMLMEQAAGEPFYRRAARWLRASLLRLEAFRSGATARRMLSQENRFVGTFRLGTARSAVIPSWLIGDLVEIAGPGAAHQAIGRARRGDRRPGAAAYYDAFSVEVQAALEQHGPALALCEKALSSLSPGEALLRGRLMAVAAREAERADRSALADRYYQGALQTDRGIFRRLGLPIPVRLTTGGGDTARLTARYLSSSPRLRVDDHGFEVRIRADRAGGSACLLTAAGAVLGCGRHRARSVDDAAAVAGGIAADFHRTLFAPRIDLSQTDINALDGSNLTAPQTLDSVLGPR